MTQERKYFSKLGLLFFAGSALLYVIQWIVVVVIQNVRPEWLQNTNSSFLVSMLTMYLLGLPLLLLLVSRVKPAGTIAKHKISFGKMVIAFFMCYAVMYISNIIGVIITTVIGVLKGSPVENVLTDVVLGTDTKLLFLFTVICAPIFEELIFRKLLVDRTVKYGEGTAILLSGLIFGLFHGNLSQFAYAFSLGMFFAFIYVKSGHIRYTIILHMIVNFLGSIVSTLLLKALDYEKVLELSRQIEYTGEGSIEILQAIAPGLILLGVYLVLVMAAVLTGVILLIVYRKKFWISAGEVIIPKGKRFVTIIVNLGMLLFIGFWVIQMILQLLA